MQLDKRPKIYYSNPANKPDKSKDEHHRVHIFLHRSRLSAATDPRLGNDHLRPDADAIKNSLLEYIILENRTELAAILAELLELRNMERGVILTLENGTPRIIPAIHRHAGDQ